MVRRAGFVLVSALAFVGAISPPPSPIPSASPSSIPSSAPTLTAPPTQISTTSPAPTSSPSELPTNPSPSPTQYFSTTNTSSSPSPSPTQYFSNTNTSSPSPSPTQYFSTHNTSSSPSQLPTASVQAQNLSNPSQLPTASPSQLPTASPSPFPTTAQSPAPTQSPNLSPPTTIPTANVHPSTSPSAKPSFVPSLAPSIAAASIPTPSPNVNFEPTYLPDTAKEPTISPALPNPPTRLPTLSPIPASDCVPEYISDGYCDEENNVEECSWDGGDCCPSTCVDTVDYECGTGVNEFDCKDPAAIMPPSWSPTHSPSMDTVFSPGETASFSAALVGIAVITGIVALGLGCYYCQQQDSRSSPEEGCSSRLSALIPSFSSGRRKRPSGGSDDARAVELARFERMSQRSDAYPNPGSSRGTGGDDDSSDHFDSGSRGSGRKKGGVMNPLGGQSRWPKDAEDSASLI